MDNQRGIRTCPVCGLELGQKNICPVCGSQKTDQTNGSGNGLDGASAIPDHVSRVIEFVDTHMLDWDNEFSAFFEQLDGCNSFTNCYKACSRIHALLASMTTGLPRTGRIPGSIMVKTMAELQEVFPDISEDMAHEIAATLLEKKQLIAALSRKPAEPPKTPKPKPPKIAKPVDVAVDVGSAYVPPRSGPSSGSGNAGNSITVSAGGSTIYSPSFLNPSYQAVDPRIKAKVREIIEKQLAVSPDQVTNDARFIEDLNADSLDIVELIMALEEEFGSVIPDEEAEKLKTVGDAIRYIESRL